MNKKIVIALIIIFSFIFIYKISFLFIELNSIKKQMTKKSDEVNKIIVETQIDDSNNVVLPETESTNQDEKINIDNSANVPANNIKEESINYSNIYVTSAEFTDNGINLAIHIETDIDPKIIVEKDSQKEYELTKVSKNNYKISLETTSLSNGNYKLYIKSDKTYSLVNKLDMLKRIVRANVNNKLVSVDYSNNIMSFKIEDFTYQYDILIDPGHGGIDSGTYNSTINESELNLMQSLYEKERYEAHGLKVELSRNDNTDGMMMGDKNWNRAKLRGYAIGYNGVFAKIVYSNHHNSTESAATSGFEILVSSQLNASQLDSEIKITKELLNVYPKNLLTNPYKIYSRNIETGNAHNKIDGKIYDYEDYYATIRIPLQLFNVKTVTYEGAYMSNKANFDWYYNGGWKIMSEVKIKYYVEALGKTYIPI